MPPRQPLTRVHAWNTKELAKDGERYCTACGLRQRGVFVLAKQQWVRQVLTGTGWLEAAKPPPCPRKAP